MPNSPSSFDTGAATHVGMVRERNEDRYLVRPDAGIWTVADGMGGHEAGDLASSAVIEALETIEVPTSASDLLARCEARVIEANARLQEIGRRRGGAIIGTTVAVLLIYGSDYACVWSGDSRIYLIRDGKIEQLSRDHTYVEELIGEGSLNREEARNWSKTNVITRAIGVYDNPELEMIDGALQPGDAFVVCSDGLTAHVEDHEILETVSANTCQRACDELIALTLKRGALDNVTVVVARYQPGDVANPSSRGPVAHEREQSR